jgi:hypothetical protein
MSEGNELEYRFRLAIALSVTGLVLVAIPTAILWLFGIWHWVLAGFTFVGIVLVGVEVIVLFKVFGVLKAKRAFG